MNRGESWIHIFNPGRYVCDEFLSYQKTHSEVLFSLTSATNSYHAQWKAIASIVGIAYSRFLVPAPCMNGSGLSRPHPFCRLGLARAGGLMPLAGTAPHTSSRYPLALIAYPGLPADFVPRFLGPLPARLPAFVRACPRAVDLPSDSGS